MKITIEVYEKMYSFESSSNDYTSDQMKEVFTRMLVLCGYPPSVIETADGGRYECEYIGE